MALPIGFANAFFTSDTAPGSLSLPPQPATNRAASGTRIRERAFTASEGTSCERLDRPTTRGFNTDTMGALVAPRTILYTGKGGVGKTSVAAATARRCAEHGLRTVVLS